MDKRGISAVVATVLIILVTVAAVTIIWAVVLPMIKNNLSAAQSSDGVTIDLGKGYTAYDSNTKISCVQVKRENDGANVVGAQIIFVFEGNSETAIINSTELPAPNQEKTFCYNLSNRGNPTSIKIAPIFRIDNKDIIGAESSIVDNIPKGVLDNVDNLVYLNGSSSGAPVGSECTGDIFCDDDNVCTSGDIQICTNGFLGACEGTNTSGNYISCNNVSFPCLNKTQTCSNGVLGACTFRNNFIDGYSCGGGNVCSGGACVSPGCTSNASCNDSNVCTSDVCNLGTGVCSNTNVVNGTSCGLNKGCFGGSCGCTLNSQCADTNSCTNDTCTIATGACLHTNFPNLFSCGGGNLCFSGVCNSYDGYCSQFILGECDGNYACAVQPAGCTGTPAFNCEDYNTNWGDCVGYTDYIADTFNIFGLCTYNGACEGYTDSGGICANNDVYSCNDVVIGNSNGICYWDYGSETCQESGLDCSSFSYEDCFALIFAYDGGYGGEYGNYYGEGFGCSDVSICSNNHPSCEGGFIYNCGDFGCSYAEEICAGPY